MIIGRLNHGGIATPSVEASVALYRDLLGATSIGTPSTCPGRECGCVSSICSVEAPSSLHYKVM